MKLRGKEIGRRNEELLVHRMSVRYVLDIGKDTHINMFEL